MSQMGNEPGSFLLMQRCTPSPTNKTTNLHSTGRPVQYCTLHTTTYVTLTIADKPLPHAGTIWVAKKGRAIGPEYGGEGGERRD